MNKRKSSAAASQDSANSRVLPDLPSEFSALSHSEIQALSGSREWTLSERRFNGESFAGIELSKVTAEGCVFERVSLNQASVRSMRCKDVVFANCDLANLHVGKMSATRVEFKNCRMTGVRFIENECKDVLIHSCDATYAQFRFSVIDAAEFDDSNLEEADFYSAKLSSVKFSNCKLLNAEMSHAKLTDVDLRGSIVDGLKLNAEDIRGAIVDPAQALAFAPLLGIRIR